MRRTRMLSAVLLLLGAATLPGCGNAKTGDIDAEFGGPEREKRQKMMEKNIPAAQKSK